MTVQELHRADLLDILNQVFFGREETFGRVVNELGSELVAESNVTVLVT